MGRRRRNSILEELFEGLFDVLSDASDMFWQVGAVVSAVLMLMTFLTLDWVADQYAHAATSPYLGALINGIGWMLYLLPLMIAVFAVIFGVKAYQAYCREHRY